MSETVGNNGFILPNAYSDIQSIAALTVVGIGGFPIANTAADQQVLICNSAGQLVWRQVDWADLTSIPATFPIATPGTLTVATTNNAAGAHTHAITSSSTPSNAAVLLATNANGAVFLTSNIDGPAFQVNHYPTIAATSLADQIALFFQSGVTVNSGQSVPSVRGVSGVAYPSGAGTITDLYGGYFDAGPVINQSLSITRAHGLYTRCLNLTGNTIVTGYGLYVDGPTGTFSAKYGIYQATTSISNYFASPTTFAAGISTGSTATTWNSGTAFPGSPATNDRFFRTDLGFLCYYDGTRWLTAHEYSYQAPYNTGSATGTITNTFARIRNDYATWFTRVAFNTQVATTNDGSNYWTFQIISYNTTFAANTVIFSVSTNADTVNVWTNHDATPSTQNPANYGGLVVNVSAKTGTPGAFAVMANIYYRLIVT